MSSRGLVALLLLLPVLVMVPAPAQGVGPSITNLTWTPWVPAFRENVIVEADVAGPAPINVTASWCILPPFTCKPFDMKDLDGDGRYTSSPIFASDTAGPGVPATGAHFNVSVVDSLSNYAFTAEIYVAFANTTTVDVGLTPPSALPSEAVGIVGSAVYQNNSSVPAKFSTVGFRILETGASWSVVSDGTGAFTSNFFAPATVGSYTLRTTVSNRTISGSRDRYLAVATAPTPDLAVVPGSLRVTPSSLMAGGVVTISLSVENRGTAAAGAFAVRFNITDPSGATLTQNVFVTGLAAGAHTDLTETWIAPHGAVAGRWTVTVIVDSAAQVLELSEENNRAEGAVTVAPGPSNGPSVTLMVGLVIAGIGVAAAVVFAHRWRAGRRKGP